MWLRLVFIHWKTVYWINDVSSVKMFSSATRASCPSVVGAVMGSCNRRQWRQGWPRRLDNNLCECRGAPIRGGVRVSISAMNCWPQHEEGSAQPAACHFSSFGWTFKRERDGTWDGGGGAGRKPGGCEDKTRWTCEVWPSVLWRSSKVWPLWILKCSSRIINQRLLCFSVTPPTHRSTASARCHLSFRVFF